MVRPAVEPRTQAKADTKADRRAQLRRPSDLRALAEMHGVLAGAECAAGDDAVDVGSFMLGAAVACAWMLGNCPIAPVEWLTKYGLDH